jgi:hypothetical protein
MERTLGQRRQDAVVHDWGAEASRIATNQPPWYGAAADGEATRYVLTGACEVETRWLSGWLLVSAAGSARCHHLMLVSVDTEQATRIG